MGKIKKVRKESDFIAEEPIAIVIDGKEFKIRELDGMEADKLTNKYVSIDQESGNLIADISVRNGYWLGNCVVDAPYEKDGKKFKELNSTQKTALLVRLKPKIRIPLVQAISDLNSVESGVAKNYKKQS